MNTRTILYVEDEENDVFFMQHAWKKAGISNPLKIVTDGEQALQYLAGEGKYANRDEYPLPSLVLLDLKLPKMDGLEVLQWIRTQPAIQTLAVIILSSSNRPEDLRAAYARGANSFLVKPSTPGGLAGVVASVKDYWSNSNGLPPGISAD
jgi:CheY-like chemotaxis protein